MKNTLAFLMVTGGILLLIALSYLVFVGLSWVIIWAFNLHYNPWVFGAGVYAGSMIARAILRK